MSLLMGIDVGTTSTRALVVNETGELLAAATLFFKVSTVIKPAPEDVPESVVNAPVFGVVLPIVPGVSQGVAGTAVLCQVVPLDVRTLPFVPGATT